METGEVVGTAKLEQRPSWRNALLSDGTTVDSAFIGTGKMESNIGIPWGCFAADTGRPCKFCGLVPAQEQTRPMSIDEMLAAVEHTLEATIVAVQNGWRGGIVFTGGGVPPERRDQWTTDLLEAMMTRFRESLDDETLSQLTFRTSMFSNFLILLIRNLSFRNTQKHSLVIDKKFQV